MQGTRGSILGVTTKSFITTVMHLATEQEELSQTLELTGLKKRLRFKEFLETSVTIVPPRIPVALKLSTPLKEILVSLTAMAHIGLPINQEMSMMCKMQSF